jgi:hypothetical protein
LRQTKQAPVPLESGLVSLSTVERGRPERNFDDRTR